MVIGNHLLGWHCRCITFVPQQALRVVDRRVRQEEIDIIRLPRVKVRIPVCQDASCHAFDEHDGDPGAGKKTDRGCGFGLHLQAERGRLERLFPQWLDELRRKWVQRADCTEPAEEPDRGSFVRDQIVEPAGGDPRPAIGQVVVRFTQAEGVKQDVDQCRAQRSGSTAEGRVVNT
jgi:hypothetical protein